MSAVIVMADNAADRLQVAFGFRGAAFHGFMVALREKRERGLWTKYGVSGSCPSKRRQRINREGAVRCSNFQSPLQGFNNP
jgi:hypothetical protein